MSGLVSRISESLVWPTSVPQALFFPENTTVPEFLTMSILETVRIVRISISMDLGTCLKRRAPKNHEFWRYSDLQISHHDPIGDQNDENFFLVNQMETSLEFLNLGGGSLGVVWVRQFLGNFESGEQPEPWPRAAGLR